MSFLQMHEREWKQWAVSFGAAPEVWREYLFGVQEGRNNDIIPPERRGTDGKQIEVL